MYAWRLLQLHAPETQLLELRRQLDDWEPRCRRCGRKSCGRRHPDCGLRRMGPQRLLLSAVLLLAQTVLEEASQHCSRLEYWNPDNLCCGSCLQRFGPPPCPGYEFSENCGLNDFGDHVTYPFKKCPRGQCNPDSEELCSSCGGRARPPTPAGTPPRCREKPVPTKEPCPVKPETPSVLNSLESSLPAISNASRTSEYTSPWQALLTFAPPVVLVLLVTAAAILLLTLQRHSRAILHPYPDLACDYNTSRGSLEASEAGDSGFSASTPKQISPGHAEWGKMDWKPTLSPPLPSCLPELPNLASQPLSRLLDELEVLEELIVLLDPEPGPGGALACGTTRHLAARYGLPAAWSTFAYSLRPSRSPLRALIEMVVAREPSASLGQLGTHLAQLGRADALQVLSKLGSSGACLT